MAGERGDALGIQVPSKEIEDTRFGLSSRTESEVRYFPGSLGMFFSKCWKLEASS